MAFSCGLHRALVYERGGVNEFGELTPLTEVRWQRIRDDISNAEAVVGTEECCDLLAELRCILHELHIVRNDQTVWQGPITRLEYEHDHVRIFAEDVLWPTKRCVIEQGYSNAYPNIGYVLPRMNTLLRTCYSHDGDPWQMLSHIHPIFGPDDPRTARVVEDYQMYVWEDFDKYAEDYGADYTVINRDIFFYDTQLQWHTLPPLDESHLSQFPRIVEYGNQLGTRGIVTDGLGHAGVADGPAGMIATYGTIDWLITNQNDGQRDKPPTAEEVAGWARTARRNILERSPTPLGVVIPADTTLLPGAPWEVDDLIPGAWFEISTTRMCRSVTEMQRIHEVTVTETAPDGENVAFTAITAPNNVVQPEV